MEESRQKSFLILVLDILIKCCSARENALFLRENDQFTCRTATTIKEDQELIEAGFEYVTERDGMKIHKKCK